MRLFSVSISFSIAVMGAIFTNCTKHNSNTISPQRSYRMGFSSSAPRPELNAIMQSLNIWTVQADAAIISTDVPWDSLLDGENAATLVRNSNLQLAQLYRNANLKLWVYIDPANGLDRMHDSRALSQRGKSIANPDLQSLYVDYICAIDSIVHPDHLGLALETNLIRYSSPDSIYQGVRSVANAAAFAIRKFDTNTPLSVSIQAETA